MSAEPVRTSGGDSTPSAPFALLLYGEEYANLGLADELALDGYEVRRASDPAMLRAACDTGEIEVVIFGQPTRRGSGLDVLRQLRAGALAPEVTPMLRTLWMSPNGDLGDVLRGFEAGADDVLRTPFAYPEFHPRPRASPHAPRPRRHSRRDRVRGASDRHRSARGHDRSNPRRSAPAGVRTARASCA
jgi:DNA-binding response OmpR family regulator